MVRRKKKGRKQKGLPRFRFPKFPDLPEFPDKFPDKPDIPYDKLLPGMNESTSKWLWLLFSFVSKGGFGFKKKSWSRAAE